MDQCESAAERALRWRDAGIPEGYSISNLMYNEASEVLVIEVRHKDASHCERLLFRHIQAPKYELIGNPEEDVAFKSPAICEKRPLFVFNSMKWHRDPDGSRRGADWDGLYTFDLRERQLNLCVSKDNLVVPPPYDDRGWIAQILSLSDDARHAYVKVGLGKRREEGEKKIVKMDYHLARLDLRTKELQLITYLKNIWF